MSKPTQPILDLLAAALRESQDPLVALQRVEEATNLAIDRMSLSGVVPAVEAYLDYLVQIDWLIKLAGCPLFDSERLTNAYTKLRPAEASRFWEKGLPKLREIRAGLWAQAASA